MPGSTPISEYGSLEFFKRNIFRKSKTNYLHLQTFVWNPKWTVWVNSLLKLGIAAALSWALYRQLAGRVEAERLWETLLSLLQGEQRFYLLAVLLLMPFNWALEVLKWKQFIPKTLDLSFWRLSLAIFSGVTFSLFTPNRLGDYLGRVIMVRSQANWNVFVATLAANLCQLAVLLLFGWVGLLVFTQNTWAIDWQYYKVFLILTLLGTICLLFFLFQSRALVNRLLKWSWLAKYKEKAQKYFKVLQTYDYRVLGSALSLAALRYLVYASQYVLMLYFVGIEINIWIAYAGIATIFLVQTSIPLPPALGLLARGEIALLVWGNFTTDSILILAASYGLFIINLTLPALIGMLAVLRVNILKSLGYEKNTPENH